MCISLLGWILMVSQKYKEASQFIYNPGFYVMIKMYPDHGEGLEGQAIKKRLKIFETKSLKQKNISVTGKLDIFDKSDWG